MTQEQKLTRFNSSWVKNNYANTCFSSFLVLCFYSLCPIYPTFCRSFLRSKTRIESSLSKAGEIPISSAGPEACPWFMPPRGKAAMALSPRRKATKSQLCQWKRDFNTLATDMSGTCRRQNAMRIDFEWNAICKCLQFTFCELSTSIFPLTRNSITASYTVSHQHSSCPFGLDRNTWTTWNTSTRHLGGKMATWTRPTAKTIIVHLTCMDIQTNLEK